MQEIKKQDLNCEIIAELAILSENRKGERKELNLIKWGWQKPMLDIRKWGPNHEYQRKQCTLTKEEAIELRDALNSIDFESDIEI